MNDSSLELLLGILIACLLMSAFFSASETGMMSLNRYRLKHLRKNHRGARLATRLLERPDRLLGLILIGNNLVNILASAIATVIALRVWGDAGIAIATGAMTILVLIVGEVTPKTLAALHPERIAFPAAYVLNALMYVFYPLVWCINHITNGLLKVLGINPDKRPEDALSSEELRTIVGESGPMIPPRHKRMLLNILDLEEVTVDDIMIPRHEIRGIDVEEDDAQIIEALRTSEHTRLILYREDIGNILGILHLRTVSLFLNGERLDREAMQRTAADPYFVPEGTPLNTQLLNFQKLKRRMGIVVDEYGSVRGLVTLEDILEEIVGEFTSNISDQSPEIVPQTDGSFVIDGATAIRDINRALHWELPIDGPKTLNGLILEYLETIPEAHVGMRLGRYHFEILELQGKVIQKVRASHPRGG
ncbi:MAG: HlyC/CorC family transporter [Gammaproteobacteria bacterium]|nr:HlyC/CorC family transporter [Gammaproteobacteria bacterium]